jgi:hypothetical protein
MESHGLSARNPNGYEHYIHGSLILIVVVSILTWLKVPFDVYLYPNDATLLRLKLAILNWWRVDTFQTLPLPGRRAAIIFVAPHYAFAF